MFKKYWLGCLLLALPWLSVQAAEVCTAMSDSDNSYIKAKQSDALAIAELQKRMDDFIKLAKKSSQQGFKMKQLITQMSRFDASQDVLRKELKEMPDKFSLYGGIERSDVVTALDWGKYKIAVVQYEYQGQVVEEAQAFFCATGGCRLSNLLERGKAPEKIALRFIHRLKFSQWKGEGCPKAKASYAILPSIGPSSSANPLQVYVKYSKGYPPLKPELLAKQDALLKASMGSFYRCVERVRKYKLDDLYADETHTELKSFLSDCTVNMELGNMVPVLRGNTLTYLPPVSLINVLQNRDLEPLASIAESGVHYKVYGVKGAQAPANTLIVLPLVGNGSSKIDWDYFNRDFSYLLLTPGFKRLLSRSS